jgi:hypothetical protein
MLAASAAVAADSSRLSCVWLLGAEGASRGRADKRLQEEADLEAADGLTVQARHTLLRYCCCHCSCWSQQSFP